MLELSRGRPAARKRGILRVASVRRTRPWRSLFGALARSQRGGGAHPLGRNRQAQVKPRRCISGPNSSDAPSPVEPTLLEATPADQPRGQKPKGTRQSFRCFSSISLLCQDFPTIRPFVFYFFFSKHLHSRPRGSRGNPQTSEPRFSLSHCGLPEREFTATPSVLEMHDGWFPRSEPPIASSLRVPVRSYIQQK